MHYFSTRYLLTLLNFLLFFIAVSIAFESNASAIISAASLPMPVQEKIHTLIEQNLSSITRQFQNPEAIHAEIAIGLANIPGHLAACTDIGAFLPTSTVVWGKIHVGLRCMQPGVKWRVFVPIIVKISGPALVTTHPVHAGELLSLEDMQLKTIELSQYPLMLARQFPTQVQLLKNQLLQRSLATGQPLRQEYVRAPTIISAGDHVRILMRGSGFAVGTHGKALQSASADQPIRVLIENGRVLTGVARPNHQIEVSL